MKKLLYLIFIIGFTGIINAQQWELVDSGTTDKIADITFKDQYLGFYSTSTGEIFRTLNGGNSWTMIYQNTDNVNGIWSLLTTNDSLYGFYSSFDEDTETTYNLKLKSVLDDLEFATDTISEFPIFPKFWNNEIWSTQKISQMLADLSFINTGIFNYTISGNYISASGGSPGNNNYIYYSDDFGVTWQQKQYSPTYGYGALLRHTYYNGGDTFVSIHTNLYDTWLFKSTDSGTTWESVEDIFLGSARIHFFDENSWLLHKMGSILYTTTDGGATYESETLIADIQDILFVNDQLGFVYGKEGMLYKTASDEDEPLSVIISTENNIPAEITINETLQLVATIEPLEAGQAVTWSVVEGEEFAQVDQNGLVTALSNGVATVRATSVENEYLYDEITITITNQTVEVLEVIVTTQDDVPALITTENGILQLIATVEPLEAEQTVIWSVVVGSEFAQVDQNGLVTAIDNGLATVRATSASDEDIYGEIVIVVDVPLSIEDIAAGSIKVYPNPAKDKINIEFTNTVEIQSIHIIDLQGKQVKSYQKEFKVLDIQDLKHGIYLLHITAKNGNFTEKIIIE